MVSVFYMCRKVGKNIFHRITKCRIVEIGRNLWRSSSPIPFTEQVKLGQVAQHSIPLDFEYHRDGGSAASLSNTLQCWTTLIGERVQQEFPVFMFVPIVSCSVSGHCWNVFFIPLHQEFIHTDQMIHPLRTSLLQAEQIPISHPLLICWTVQSFNHLHGPYFFFFFFCAHQKCQLKMKEMFFVTLIFFCLKTGE